MAVRVTVQVQGSPTEVARLVQLVQAQTMPLEIRSSATEPQRLELQAQLDALLAQAGLTAREREVIAYYCQGWRRRALAQQLHISVRTLDTHWKHIYHRLGIRHRSELDWLLSTYVPRSTPDRQDIEDGE
jgi:DNA-binding NarL/FixJ family response regulator